MLKLLALATAAFLTLLTEIMPAGLLSAIAMGLDVSESLAGQFITAFALGALLSAIPFLVLSATGDWLNGVLCIFGPGAFPWVMIGLLTLSFFVVILGVNRALTAAKPAQAVSIRSDSLMQSNQHL